MSDTHTTVLGSDARFNGELTFEGAARILGSFEGRIASKGELQIAENASCKASVEVGRLLLDGTVDGDVTARERLEVTAKARLKGNIVSPRLTVAEGATLVGHVTIGESTGMAVPAVDASAMIEAKPATAAQPNRPAYLQAATGRPDPRGANRAELIARR
jgi:cytoskeletal protein CcmA (bactofilin family)